MNYVYFISDGLDTNQIIFNDLKKIKNVNYIDGVFKIENELLRFLNKVHLSSKVKSKVNLPMKRIWDKFNYLNQVKFNNNDTYYLVFLDTVIPKYNIEFLNKLSSRENIKLVLLLMNPLCNLSSFDTINFINEVNFYKVLSFDKEDAVKNEFIHTMNTYSKIDLKPCQSINKDLFFIGLNKGRLEKLLKVYEEVTKRKGICEFYINKVKRSNQKYADSIHYNERMTYLEVLESLQKTNCLIELLQEGQHGMTLRAFEAICYNKKLITNNKDVINLPFYDERYIQIINDIDDIDYDFIFDKTIVNYGYKDEFSPKYLLQSIIE